jgi:hypothetical protein
MFFGVNNGPPTSQRVVTKTFKEYLDNFMKIFLYDFTIYNDIKTHLQKLRLCFQKCKEYKINLNPSNCDFMVFYGMILGFIISKKGKLPNPKKKHAMVNMPIPHNSLQIEIFNQIL